LRHSISPALFQALYGNPFSDAVEEGDGESQKAEIRAFGGARRPEFDLVAFRQVQREEIIDLPNRKDREADLRYRTNRR
jgi:hypothetical protein